MSYAKVVRLRRIERIGQQGEARRQRNVYLNFAYKVSLEWYEDKLQSQGGVCAICKRPPLGKKPLHVDHNHQTGAVRDLLCRRCNVMVGYLEKFPELLSDVQSYIARHAQGR